MTTPQTHTADGRPRVRGIGISLAGEPGPLNAITDVAGIEVGTVTLIDGDGPLVVGRGPVRTGVTAILPRGREGVGRPCAAGWYSLNGNGELTGTTWIEESGTFNVPIVLSNTHAVGACHTGVVTWINEVNPRLAGQWLLPVCGETWDGDLNDANGGHVRPEHVVAALDSATSGPVTEGSVGGGTGMNCYEFKGGSGTASRLVAYGDREYTLGVFLQTNFGARRELAIAGVPLGEALADDNPMAEAFTAPPGAGSCIGIVITDAPLLPDQCRALARRVTLGLARSGTTGSHFSGDLFLALSVANPGAFTPGFRTLYGDAEGELDRLDFVPWGHLDRFFEAVVQATEEAVVNALIANEDMVGYRGHRTPSLPRDRVVELLKATGRIG